MHGDSGIEAFETARATLMGLAYRILGSHADAEDAVQDTFLKWRTVERSEIASPAAWLTTACTRRCLDMLRAAHRSRVDYVGAWLPEPIHTAVDGEGASRHELASSLTTAFLLMLERLTPKERAAYLLHEIFDVPYPQIAETLDMAEAACRKLVSRARLAIEQAKVRHVTPRERQDQLVAAFQAAITSGAPAGLAALLSGDIRLCADGGGKVATVTPLAGKADVLTFLTGRLREYWAGYDWIAADVNGGPGVILERDGRAEAAVTFAYDEDGRASGIFIVRNPDKLAGLRLGGVR